VGEGGVAPRGESFFKRGVVFPFFEGENLRAPCCWKVRSSVKRRFLLPAPSLFFIWGPSKKVCLLKSGFAEEFGLPSKRVPGFFVARDFVQKVPELSE